MDARIGAHTDTGNRYGSLNQDWTVIQELYTPAELHGQQQTYVVAICDGHGVLGDKSAKCAGNALARYLFSSPTVRGHQLSKLSTEVLEKEMKAAFHKGHQAALSLYEAPPKQVNYPKLTKSSRTLVQYTLTKENGFHVYRTETGPHGPGKLLECGTTCTAALLQGSTVCLANVGDSSAFLGHYVEDPHAPGAGHYEARQLTAKHNGLDPGERARMAAEDIAKHAAIVSEDGYVAAISGPWSGYELSVTRALGHRMMAQCGVIPDPHVVTLQAGPDDCCLVIASDGVWDVMNGREAVSCVMDAVAEGKSAKQAAEQLVKDAVKLGLDGPHGEADNTSALVVLFH